MECVRYADRSFDYEVWPAAEMGCQLVESCLLNGRDLLLETGYHHFRSMRKTRMRSPRCSRHMA